MNSKIKNVFSISLTVLLATLMVVVVVKATAGSGLLNPVAAPSAGPTMHTITDIYNKLTGATVTPHTDLNPTGAPTDGTYTLEDVYNAVPTDGTATEGDVCNSKTFYAGGGAIRTGGRTNCSAPTASLVWQTDPALNLCWSAGAYELASGCSDGVGLLENANYPTNPQLLGANEYCQYLNSNGTTIGSSANTQGAGGTPYWHLPTQAELMVAMSNSWSLDGLGIPGGFQDSYGYWSSLGNDSSYAWNAFGHSGGSVYSSTGIKSYGYLVRCAH